MEALIWYNQGMTIPVEFPTDWTDYQLIDSGNGEKLERFGNYTMVRPDPRVLWGKLKSSQVWEQADANFSRIDSKSGFWQTTKQPPNDWHVSYGKLTFMLRPTEFKHVGVFPEQAVNWTWLTKVIDNRPLNVLNLFAYTGGATMAAVAAGARVTHVDAAKSATTWAHENVKASGLDGNPIRWIEDDALKFVSREAKRGNTYDGIIMDPPRFGRGTKGEVWKLEDSLPKLFAAVKDILSHDLAFFLINAYTADLSSIVIGQMVSQLTDAFKGTTTFGELAIKESDSDRLLPNGIFARWSRM